MHDFAAVYAQSELIDGWLTAAQARLLFDLGSHVGPGETAVEIGSHHGKSTVVLAGAVSSDATLIAIDPFDDPRWGGGEESLSMFQANIAAAGVTEKVRLKCSLSGEVARTWSGGQTIRLLYVDGAHDYETASEDITLWQQHMLPGAYLLVHDAFSSVGVTRAVLRHLGASKTMAYGGAAGSLIWFRQESASRGSRLRLASRLGFFVRNVAVKLALQHDRPAVARALGHDSPHMPI